MAAVVATETSPDDEVQDRSGGARIRHIMVQPKAAPRSSRRVAGAGVALGVAALVALGVAAAIGGSYGRAMALGIMIMAALAVAITFLMGDLPEHRPQRFEIWIEGQELGWWIRGRTRTVPLSSVKNIFVMGGMPVLSEEMNSGPFGGGPPLVVGPSSRYWLTVMRSGAVEHTIAEVGWLSPEGVTGWSRGSSAAGTGPLSLAEGGLIAAGGDGKRPPTASPASISSSQAQAGPHRCERASISGARRRGSSRDPSAPVRRARRSSRRTGHACRRARPGRRR